MKKHDVYREKGNPFAATATQGTGLQEGARYGAGMQAEAFF